MACSNICSKRLYNLNGLNQLTPEGALSLSYHNRGNLTGRWRQQLSLKEGRGGPVCSPLIESQSCSNPLSYDDF